MAKWTPEQRRKFRKTIRAKAKARAASEIPLHLIPERVNGTKVVKVEAVAPIPKVYAEFDVTRDSMYLIMGSTRLPLRVRG